MLKKDILIVFAPGGGGGGSRNQNFPSDDIDVNYNNDDYINYDYYYTYEEDNQSVPGSNQGNILGIDMGEFPQLCK